MVYISNLTNAFKATVFNRQKILLVKIEEACGNSRVQLKKKWNSCFQW